MSDNNDNQNEIQSLLESNSTEGNNNYYSSISNNTHLNKLQGKRNSFKLYIFIIILSILTISSFILFNILLINNNSQDIIEKSMEFNINNVEINRLTSNGIDLKLIGFTKFDYNKVETFKNSYIGKLMKFSTKNLISKIDIKLDQIQLKIKLDDDDNELIDIGSIEIPEFSMFISQHSITPLDLIVSIHPKTLEILHLIKHLLSNDKTDNVLKIYCDSNLDLKFFKFFHLSGLKIKFNRDFLIDGKFRRNDLIVDLNEINIDRIDSIYNINFQILLLNPIQGIYPFTILSLPKFPQSSWEIFINGCNEEKIKLLSNDLFYTDPFKISSMDDFINLNISTSISKINNELFEICSLDLDDDDDLTPLDLDDDDLTPLDVLIDEFINNRSIPLKIQNLQNNSIELPKFLTDILSKILIINLNYISKFNSTKLIQNVSIDNLKFEFENGDINKPIINGEINLYINLPIDKIKGIDYDNFIKIPKIKTSNQSPIKLYHNEEEFARIELIEWHDCFNEFLINDQIFHLKFKLIHESIIVKNPKIFKKVINEILINGKSKIFIDSNLDIIVQIYKLIDDGFEIKRLNAKSESDITR
ncbi:hypothetical protein WICMUC_003350 [Wickerhamomyces mucosus]|uniref:Tag1 C-terminal domain-containing protein n=1 Tax=Wickerhamomyces mucosus TaxID=1378264 RepID=A0A9P8PMU8_9ASCO|nr:hypothetical protein WICMUC_003350 [Wickerhamomyces mucosus]